MAEDAYRRIAGIYDRYIEPANHGVRQIGLKLFPPQAGMRVLDIGCGTGTSLDLYSEAGCYVYGVDLSPAMMNVAHQKLGKHAHLYYSDASEMPFPQGFFDLVTAVLTLHEMPGKIRPQVLREIARVLKPSGHILLVDFHPGPLSFPKGWMYKGFTLFFEISAGQEHFRNYRSFIAQRGLPGLLAKHDYNIHKKKIISGGNLALYLLSK